MTSLLIAINYDFTQSKQVYYLKSRTYLEVSIRWKNVSNTVFIYLQRLSDVVYWYLSYILYLPELTQITANWSAVVITSYDRVYFE